MTPLKIAFAITAMFTLLVVFAVQRIPAPRDPIIFVTAAEEQFDEAWIDILGPLALKKADLERTLTTSTDPKSVLTERIELMPPAPDVPTNVPPVILVQVSNKPLASRHGRHVVLDVCERHHLKKISIRGGRSWRCRK